MTKDKDLPLRHPMAFIQDIKDRTAEAAVLREWLDGRRIAYADFARCMGFKPAEVNAWVHGMKRIPPKIYIEICEMVQGIREIPPEPHNYFRK